LPWIEQATGNSPGSDNFRSLRALDWQVHVYGSASPSVAALCKTHRIDLHAFPWRDPMGGVGLVKDAAYLLRPDAYIGCMDATPAGREIATYLETWGVHPLAVNA